MKILGNETVNDILIELGKRIKARRISFSITQDELSMRSGVSLRTITDIEKGMNVSLKSLLPILSVLKLVENIDLLVPDSKADPFEVMKLGHKRKRVSNKINVATNWKWGDEK